MRVVIIGAGKVGYRIAATLSKELYDVVIIDNNQRVIDKVNDNLDVLAINSNGLIGETFKKLKLSQNDLVIAVTENDEGNMLACLSAKYLGVSKTIARIRNPEYEYNLALPKEKLGIDYVINPEKSTANEIVKLLTLSPAGKIEQFAKGSVQMVQMKVEEGSCLDNIAVKNCREFGDLLFAAILRGGNVIIPKGDEVIRKDDNIYIIGKRDDIVSFCDSQSKTPIDLKNVMILGGGRISIYLAQYLEELGVSTKIIEHNEEICQRLSEQLPNSLIIKGDGTDIKLLKSENIDNMDAFIALTGFDEGNILAALLAKNNGAKKGVAKVSRDNYISLATNIGVDASLTPSIITTSEILSFVMEEWVVSESLLFGGQVEVIEFEIKKECLVKETPIKEIDFPNEALLTTIIRDGKVIIPHGEDILEIEDNVIVIAQVGTAVKLKKTFYDKGEKNGFWNSVKNIGKTTSS